MGVGYSTFGKWVWQLREERDDKSPQATPMTPEQREPRKLVPIPESECTSATSING